MRDEAGDEGDYQSACLDIDETIHDATNVENALRKILAALADGRDIAVEGSLLDDSSRRPLHATLLALLMKGHAYRESQRAGAGASAQGRKRKAIDGIRLADAIEQYEAHKLSAAEAAQELGIGEATFYRRLRESREARPTGA